MILGDRAMTWRWSPLSSGAVELAGNFGATAMDIAPDGTILAATPDKKVVLRDGLTVRPLLVDSQTPNATVAFAPDGETFAYTTGRIAVVRGTRSGAAPDGTSKATAIHPHEVRTVAFSPDGGQIVTVDSRGATRVWDLVRP